ncbi:MAG: hypothetical protein JNL10_11010 [Verrucomicrobiales bacterium]|nr:hypothetical protein [Verrucomicrobiales bacterium]
MRTPRLLWTRLAIPLLCLGSLRAQSPPAANAPSIRADQPVPRTDRNSQLAHAELLKKAAQGGIDLYFVGDSITRRWGTSDPQYRDFLANWNRNFFGWNAGNFGWGSDTIQNILWRMENGELEGVHPKVIVLLAGANNVGDTPPPPGQEGAKAEDIVAGIRALLTVIHQKAPRATVILMGLTPNNARSSTAVMPLIHQINDRLAPLADGNSVRFLNLNDRLADPDGKLYDGMTVDGLHPTVKGYQVWADALKPMLTELLGPPAKTDHAPPPTGDPSLRKPG